MSEIFIYLDTETSGLVRKDLPADDPSQPHLVEIAALVTSEDRAVEHEFSTIIRPEGWSIEPDAVKVHGITERRAHRVGISLWFALAQLQTLVEASTKIVGFNIQGFDRQMIANELRFCNQQGAWWHKRMGDLIDIMELATPIMQLPGQLHGEFKHPTLQEAVRCFGLQYDDFSGRWNMEKSGGALSRWTQAHRAIGDARATEFVHWRLRTT